MRYIFLITIFFNFSPAQEKISGLILNENEVPIQNAGIYFKDYSFGTTSDDDGFFSLVFPDSIQTQKELFMIINHVGYDSLIIPIADVLKTKIYMMQTKTFTGSQIFIEGYTEPFISKELPVSIKVIEAKKVENKGYADIGDFIRTNQSVQINEQLTGKKTVSLRAGNSDEVLILYNGIALNNNYNNSFDLSLLNIEDIKTIEIIKGSNTSLYGAEAFSGVINIIPKIEQKHTVRFVQKFGSYNSGNWNLNLNHKLIDNLYFSYSQRRSGAQRKYDTGDGVLENLSQNHTANLVYRFPNNGVNENVLNLMYMGNKNDYSNSQLLESINDVNTLFSLSYTGSIGIFSELEIVTSYSTLDTKQKITSDSLFTGRKIEDDKTSFVGRKNFNFDMLNFLLSYQYDNSNLNYNDQRKFFNHGIDTLGNIKFERAKKGAVGLLSFDLEKNTIANEMQIAFSYRYDWINDKQINKINSTNSSWEDGGIKTSFKVKKIHQKIAYTFNASVGTNTKYPSLYNQLSTPNIVNDLPGSIPNLAPEKNRSREIGLKVENENPENEKINRIEFNATYFENFYENKFRSFYSPYSAVAIFDNVKTADMNGFEINLLMSVLKNSLGLEAGISSYDISDKAAFPLKSDSKMTANISYQYSGYNVEVAYFKMGEQVAWLRDLSNNLYETILPSNTNINLHFSKYWQVYNFDIGLNFSLMNLLNDNNKLNGLIINDRRYYFGFDIKI